MTNDINSHSRPRQPITYQIRLKGHLDHQWTDWFGGLAITLEDNGDTLLTGPVVDQAALHGLLRTVRDLGIPLVSVHPIQPQLHEVDKPEPRAAGVLIQVPTAAVSRAD